MSFTTNAASRRGVKSAVFGYSRAGAGVNARPIEGETLQTINPAHTRKRKKCFQIGDPESVGLIIVGQQDGPDAITPNIGLADPEIVAYRDQKFPISFAGRGTLEFSTEVSLPNIKGPANVNGTLAANNLSADTADIATMTVGTLETNDIQATDPTTTMTLWPNQTTGIIDIGSLTSTGGVQVYSGKNIFLVAEGVGVSEGVYINGATENGSVFIGNQAFCPSVTIHSLGVLDVTPILGGTLRLGHALTSGDIHIGTLQTTGDVTMGAALTTGVITIGNASQTASNVFYGTVHPPNLTNPVEWHQEGTWDVQVGQGGTFFTKDAGNSQATYHRIGDLVTINFKITWTSKNGIVSASPLRISNLPFEVQTNYGDTCIVPMVSTGITVPELTGRVLGYMYDALTNEVEVSWHSDGAATGGAISPNDCDAAGSLIGSYSYIATGALIP